MPRWRDLAPAAAALTLAAPAAAQDLGKLLPAPTATIVAGGKVCVGTTVDPATQPARLAGWTSATHDQKLAVKTDGDVVVRDNVMLIYKSAAAGGCVVLARSQPGFDPAAFQADLAAALGVAIVPGKGDEPPQATLPNGEFMLVVLAPADEKSASRPAAERQTIVTLVLANTAAQQAKKSRKEN